MSRSEQVALLDRDNPLSLARQCRLRGGVVPGILNTDQGSQFTSDAFTDAVLASGAQVSMDGRRRCLDNVFIERLWERSSGRLCICTSWRTDSRRAK